MNYILPLNIKQKTHYEKLREMYLNVLFFSKQSPFVLFKFPSPCMCHGYMSWLYFTVPPDMTVDCKALLIGALFLTVSCCLSL